jgi:hypothetical protein
MNISSAANFYRNIKIGYGPQTKTLVSKYGEQCTKTTTLRTQFNFLKECKKYQVTPRTLQVRAPLALRDDPRAGRILHRANHSFVRLATNNAQSEVYFSTQRENEMWTDLQHVLNTEDAKTLDLLTAKRCRKVHETQSAHKENKLEKMIAATRHRATTQAATTKNVINLSSVTLSAQDESALSRGMGFGIAPKKFPTLMVITAVESAGKFLAPEKATQWRAQIDRQLRNYQKAPLRPNLSPGELKSINTLSKNKDIMVVKADKGGATVVMDKIDYERKMETLLSGGEYQLLPEDPYAEYDAELRKITKGCAELKESRVIPEPAAPNARDAPYKPPHIYGLPKVHKAGAPLRPIVSTIGSAFQPLARFLVPILSPLAEKSKISIKNANELLPRLKELKLSKFDLMCSFDVVSLFTSVPTDLILDIVKSRLEKDATKLLDRTTLKIPTILELVKFSINSTYFQFKDSFYKQTSGLAMGSSLSPILAEIFMQWLEEQVLKRFPRRPILMVRYVDDYLIIYRGRVFKINDFLALFNSIHPNIKLTMEHEVDGKIPFLDILLTKVNGSIQTSVYRKPTATEITLNFESNHSFATKFGVALSMFQRAYNYNTCNLSLKEEVTLCFNILLKNNYPRRVIKKAHNRVKNPPLPKPDKPKPAATVIIPYVKGKSEAIQAISQKFNVRTVFQNTETLRKCLMHVKPKSPPALINCVYRIPCSDCDAVYIGQTKRHVYIRFKEHNTNINKQGVNLDTVDANYSKIAFHAQKHNHKFDFEHASVICIEKNWFKRTVLEAIAMITDKSKNVVSQPSHFVDKVWTRALMIEEAHDFFLNKCASWRP